MKRIASAVVTILGLAAAPPAAAEEVSAGTCHANRDQQIAETVRNRENAAAFVKQAMERTRDAEEKESLRAELEQTWEMEEGHRALIELQFRDCMAFVKSKS